MYTLTHQVFYLEVIQQADCSLEVIQQMQDYGIDINTDLIMKTFCTNMLIDAENIADGGFPSNKQDLFLEEGLLCGLDGYHEFFRSLWLEEILTWQDKNGCYKSNHTTQFAHKATTSAYRNGERKFCKMDVRRTKLLLPLEY